MGCKIRNGPRMRYPVPDPECSSFSSEGHFASWLELTPRREVSGGKVLRQKSRKSNNRVATAPRMAAQSLWRSDSYLGARYRHLRARLGGQNSECCLRT